MRLHVRVLASLALVGGALSTPPAVAAMRGRPPKPTVLKLLNGNPGHRPLNPDEPQPEILDEACPEELLDPIARAEWARAIVPAIRIGQITEADRSLAIAHCELWAARRSQLMEAAGHANIIAAGKNKYPMPNPALTMASKTLQLLLKVDSELGFSPTSRSRVKSIKGPKVRQSAQDRKRAQFFGAQRG